MNRIKELIADNKIEQVFLFISEHKKMNKKTENSLLLLKSRFNKLENDNILGILSQSDYSVQRSQIINALIEFLDGNIFEVEKTNPDIEYGFENTLLDNQIKIINQNEEIIKQQSLLNSKSERILNKLPNQYSYLSDNQNISEKQMQTIIENIQKNENSMINIGLDIMNHINWAFEEYGKDLDEKLHEIHNILKNSDNWKTKLELSVPLINMLGINLKHEVYLNKYINRIKDKFS